MRKTKIIAFLVIATLTLGFAGGSVQALTIVMRINPIEGNSYKDEIVRQINLSRTEGDSIFKVSEIQEFYSLDNFKIDGYKLSGMQINLNYIYYYYSPTKEIPIEEDYNSNVIIISIPRPHWVDTSNPLKPLIEQFGKQYLTEDNFIYKKHTNCITAQIDNSWVRVEVPEHLNNYEFLRDLCIQVMETAELVIVDGYSQIPPAESDIATEPVIPTPPTVYENFSNWNGIGDVSARIDTDHTLFESVTFNGDAVASDNYRITAGSTIVTLLEPYLRTLPVGMHDFVVNFSNGTSVTLPLTVSTAPPSASGVPKGGVALLIVPVLVAGLVVVLNIRRIRS